MILSPANIECLLEYYYRPPGEVLRNGGDSIERLMSYDLLEPTNGNKGPIYRITARGKAHVDNLCNLPAPEIRWTVPWVDRD